MSAATLPILARAAADMPSPAIEGEEHLQLARTEVAADALAILAAEFLAQPQSTARAAVLKHAVEQYIRIRTKGGAA
jgi:hypothetical protein